jgi:hypothetical protein
VLTVHGAGRYDGIYTGLSERKMGAKGCNVSPTVPYEVVDNIVRGPHMSKGLPVSANGTISGSATNGGNVTGSISGVNMSMEILEGQCLFVFKGIRK